MPEPRLLSRTIPWWGWLFAAGGVIGLDQLTKWLIQQVLVYGQAIPVLPFFNLVLVYNPGAAFSFLSTAAGWQRELFVVIHLHPVYSSCSCFVGTHTITCSALR
jgi:signal peptidase II